VPPLQLNPDEYRQDMAQYHLTPKQENELLSALFEIMRTLAIIFYNPDSLFNTPDAESTRYATTE